MRYLIEAFRVWVVKLAFPQYWGVSTFTILAQASHETGAFTSKVYREGNNLFGMQPNSRPFDIQGKTMGRENSATYPTKWHSVWDYFKRQQAFRITTIGFKRKTVDSGYAADKAYKSKWQKHINKLLIFKILTYACIVVAVVTFLGNDKGLFQKVNFKKYSLGRWYNRRFSSVKKALNFK
ncbi:mannosyl-glycoprotein endo-beta-N-acetylglucosaminidase [Roseivirga pacifica]|uniref:Mannosyl-glycoprotein endo-beta-N-acetylglucosaminidase n=1 Tax=Roseivirga pacifica TaxID=1267423 RepID=A0A1I0Q8Z1_9BACT|nr:mannosyl-glycoprotein endo-beta-N-acetylglucosaminidase [Roseivirga pacifica]SEW23471.1 Mannosyl-glycoprotein endo-beta-N-acetylglucosaminidase [Roseivirga pacifica]